MRGGGGRGGGGGGVGGRVTWGEIKHSVHFSHKMASFVVRFIFYY